MSFFPVLVFVLVLLWSDGRPLNETNGLLLGEKVKYRVPVIRLSHSKRHQGVSLRGKSVPQVACTVGLGLRFSLLPIQCLNDAAGIV